MAYIVRFKKKNYYDTFYYEIILLNKTSLENVISITLLLSGEEEKERPNPYWASCKDKAVHNIHGKKLSIDNIFENKTISLDDYKGKVFFCYFILERTYIQYE